MKKLVAILSIFFILMTVGYFFGEKNNKSEVYVEPKFRALESSAEVYDYFRSQVDGPKERSWFINTYNNKPVKILNNIKYHGFHFYQSVEFNEYGIGILAGGAGLRSRITTDCGITWKTFSFSRFANKFNQGIISGNQVFLIGESPYIFRTQDLGISWEIFDTRLLNTAEKKYFGDYPKFRQIAFLDKNHGFILSEDNGFFISNGGETPMLLKTSDGGESWGIFETTGLPKDVTLRNLEIITSNNFILSTMQGKLFRSVDGGAKWKLIHTVDSKYGIRSLDFLNENIGLLGGHWGEIQLTLDGGKTWKKIEHAIDRFGMTISDIDVFENGFLVTMAKNTGKKYNAFLYYLDLDSLKLTEFLTKDAAEPGFEAEAWSTQVLDNVIYTLDRDKLYQLLPATDLTCKRNR